MLTFLITLYTSRIIDRWWRIGTDLYAALWGFIILTLAELATGTNPWDWRLYLAFFNSFLVAAAAGKLSDKTINEKQRRKEDLLQKIQGGDEINGDKRDWPQV